MEPEPTRCTGHDGRQIRDRLYRDVLRVREYILFDPKAEYLKPPLKGFRLVNGKYIAIDPVDERLPRNSPCHRPSL